MAAVLLQGKAQPEVQDYPRTSETQSDGEDTNATESDVIKPVAASSIKNSTDLNKVSIKDKEDGKEESEDEPEMIVDTFEVDDKDDSLETVRSPTPPPQMRGKQKSTASKKNVNQKLSNLLQTINNITSKLGRLRKTTPRHKTRGRQTDVVIVGEEEGIIKKYTVVKVRCLATVHRITMNLDEPIHYFAGQLSRLVVYVAEHELDLFFGD